MKLKNIEKYKFMKIIIILKWLINLAVNMFFQQ